MQARHLSDEFIKLSKEKLINKQQELEKEKKLLKSEDPYLGFERDIDNADQFDEAMEEDLIKENIDTKLADIEKSLEQIAKALAKIEEGTYGICEETGEPIDLARLEAYPEAITAVEE